MNQNRQPQGQPAGGQFAAHAHSDPSVALLDQPRQPGEYVNVERHEWLDRSHTVSVNSATGLTDDEYDDVVDSAIIAGLWATSDDSDVDFEANPSGMLDGRFDKSDLSDQAVARFRETVTRFVSENRADVQAAIKRPDYNGNDGTGPHGMLGHDIFLTTAGHGVGFWDREALRADGLGARLTEGAKRVPEITLYPGDDGKLYAL